MLGRDSSERNRTNSIGLRISVGEQERVDKCGLIRSTVGNGCDDPGPGSFWQGQRRVSPVKCFCEKGFLAAQCRFRLPIALFD